VVECEHGWRGEYAYPSRIYVTAPSQRQPRQRQRDRSNALLEAEALARALETYQVPVEVIAGQSVQQAVHELENRLG
jgi:hypothetical protein